MKVLSTIRKIMLYCTTFIFVVTMAVASAYWYGQTCDEVDVQISIAEEATAFTRLPANTPDDIIAKLEQMQQSGVGQEVIDLIIDALVKVVEDLAVTASSGVENDANYQGVRIASDIDALFADPNYTWGGNAAGHFLIYTEMVDGQLQYAVVFVDRDTGGGYLPINSAQDLADAIGGNNFWNGVNKISSQWSPSVLYSRWSAPVSLVTNNTKRLFLPQDAGGIRNSSSPAYNGSWREKFEGFTFVAPTLASDTVVYHNSRYYYSLQTNWGTPPVNPQSWDPWAIIHDWTQGSSYNTGAIVRTSGSRFWRALRNNTTVAPSQQSAYDGYWQEVNNGWHAAGYFNRMPGHYYSYNHYKAGDVVVYGISARNNYRYFRAKADILPEQRPIMYDQNGVAYVDTTLWEQINS